MITALLVEDEPAAFLWLRKQLEAYLDIQVIGTEVDFFGAKKFLSERKPELIFIDVGIPGGLGTEPLPFVDQNTGIVFISAHEKYAVKAFERKAIDYLLKPVTPERLDDAMQRVREFFLKSNTGQGQEISPSNPESADAIEIKPQGSSKKLLIYPASILWIEAQENYSKIKLAGGEPSSLIVRRSLNEWADVLSPEKFYRIGRGLIIQLGLLRWTESRSRDEVLLSFAGSEETLVIGRMVAAKLKRLRKQKAEERNPD